MTEDHGHGKPSDSRRMNKLYSDSFRLTEAPEELRATTILRLADGLEFELDKEIAPLIEACWKSGVFVFQSDTWSNVGTVRLHIASTAFADQFLANLFADGDIYWKSDEQSRMLGNWHEVDTYTKVIPEDWEWTINFEFMVDILEESDLLKAACIYLGITKEEIGGEMDNEPSVIVRFPSEFIGLLTERLLSKEADRPEPDGTIWKLLPDLTCFDSSYFF